MSISDYCILFAVLCCSACSTGGQESASADSPAIPYITVLGVAQDAGYPQTGCEKECCADAWIDPSLRRHVVSLGLVDPRREAAWMIDASPDFRDQAKMLADRTGAPLPTGIFLTHAHIGHYTGLMQLGKEAVSAPGLPVYCMPRMAEFLRTNGPWDMLAESKYIILHELEEDRAFQLADQLSVTPFMVPHRDEYSETVGYRVDGPQRSAIFLPDIDKWSRWRRNIDSLIRTVDYAFLDATFFADGEVSRNMNEIPHPFVMESMARFENLEPAERAKIRFIHFNHSNPLLREGSEERRRVEEAGFGIAGQGEVYEL